MNNHARIRANLDKLKHKLNSDICKIAYMGSSVTVQKEGYRIFLHQFLREYFNREHLEICAAIGGVGAITGVFTMDEDVISYDPDVCFIEYMVSDRIEANTPQGEIGKVIEGVVRKLNQTNCSVIFLYRYLEREMIGDRYDYALNEYEKIARYYNITSIDFGGYIQSCIDRQQYAHQSLFKDHTHTTTEGSKVAADYIANVLKSIFESNAKVAEQKRDIKPFYSDNYQSTTIVHLNNEFLTNKSNYNIGLCADKVKNHQSKTKDYQYIEVGTDNSFKFQIKGELIGLMVIVGRDSGMVKISANDRTDKVMLWDKWCHYDRFSTVILSQKYNRPTNVEIKLTDEAIDYSSCRREIENPQQIVKKLKLVGIMICGDTKIATMDSAIKTSTIPELIKAAKTCDKAKEYDEALLLYFKAAKIALNRRVCIAIAKHIIKRERRQKIELYSLLSQQKSPVFYVNLAHAFYELKEFDKSIACFRKAIALNSRLAEDILPIMQSARLKQDRQNEAEKLYKEWIESYYIVSHQHKIIYCPIPKNACTFFKKVVLENSEHKSSFQESGLDVHRYIRQNEAKLTNFAYLSDPEYLKIAIIRNPFDRLVSAYLNKFVRHKKPTKIVSSVIENIYRFNKLKPDYQRSVTFSDFVNYLARTEDYFLNEHWRSQYFFLGMGLVNFNLLDSLENVDSIVRKLESRIGKKIDLGKTKNQTDYDRDIAKKNWHTMYPQQLRKLDRLPTASSLYTAELKAIVKSRFALDIKMFDSLQAILNRN